MVQSLIGLDEQVLLWFNGIHHPFLDAFWTTITNKYVWLPVYLALLIVAFKKQGVWYAVFFFLVIITIVGLSDFISVHAFKNVFERLRPCKQEHLKPLLHVVNGRCGGKFGFVSSHAVNHFALAYIFYRQFSPLWRHTGKAVYTWAILVALSRVYLGVHYPLDILAGALVGTLLALVLWKLILAIFNGQLNRRGNDRISL